MKYVYLKVYDYINQSKSNLLPVSASHSFCILDNKGLENTKESARFLT